jgi:hypothetical protein
MQCMKRTPVVLQVAVNGYADRFAEYIWRTHRWAWEHGYRYRCVTAPCNLPRDDCGWLKLACVEQLLGQYRTVFLVDADAYVTKDCPVLASVLTDDGEIYARLGFSGRINSGVMIFHHGHPESTLKQAFQQLFAACDRPVPKEDKAPQENGHVIHCWKNWPTLEILPAAWNFNSRSMHSETTPFVVHGGDSENGGIEKACSYKRSMRKKSSEEVKEPAWYAELTPWRQSSRAKRVRFYARKLQEIGILQ